MTNQRKIQVLIGLGALWAVTLVIQAMESPDQPIITIEPPSGAMPSAAARLKELQKLGEPLQQARQTIALSHPRNIFHALGVNASQKKPARSIHPSHRKKTASFPSHAPPPSRIPPPPPGPSPIQLATQQARQQLQHYRFLGYLKKAGESQAFLTNGQAIYIVKQGEIVDGRITVARIAPTTVTLSMQVFPTGDVVETTILLSKETKG